MHVHKKVRGTKLENHFVKRPYPRNKNRLLRIQFFKIMMVRETKHASCSESLFSFFKRVEVYIGLHEDPQATSKPTDTDRTKAGRISLKSRKQCSGKQLNDSTIICSENTVSKIDILVKKTCAALTVEDPAPYQTSLIADIDGNTPRYAQQVRETPVGLL